jgi:hypothetical protein
LIWWLHFAFEKSYTAANIEIMPHMIKGIGKIDAYPDKLNVENPLTSKTAPTKIRNNSSIVSIIEIVIFDQDILIGES